MLLGVLLSWLMLMHAKKLGYKQMVRTMSAAFIMAMSKRKAVMLWFVAVTAGFSALN